MNQIMFGDADDLARIEGEAIIVLSITREEILSGSIASALERLMVLTDNREAVIKFRESVVFHCKLTPV